LSGGVGPEAPILRQAQDRLYAAEKSIYFRISLAFVFFRLYIVGTMMGTLRENMKDEWCAGRGESSLKIGGE
jgi:hypothetical protein